VPSVPNRREAQIRQWRLTILILIISGLLGACGGDPTRTPSPTSPAQTATELLAGSITTRPITPSPLPPTTPPPTPPPPTPSRTHTPTDTPPSASPSPSPIVSPTSTTPPSPTTTAPATSPTVAAPTTSPTVAAPTSTSATISCRLGTSLRKETVPIVLNHRHLNGLVQSASVGAAEAYFPQLEGWTRVLGAPSLEALRQKAEEAKNRGVPYEALSYGLETSESTPEEEWQDLVGSTKKAKAIADEYGKLLLMGPGFRLMSENPDKYPSMAALADLWVLQTQRLQVNPPGPEYRQDVQRVVNQIRAGNPSISVWAQITLPPDREPDADEWIAYRRSIADLVDGTYAGVYTWRSEDSELLVATLEAIFEGSCD
jgi:hypothetical protein